MQFLLDLNHMETFTVSNISVNVGSYASYIMPAAALGVMGYCYMWWKVKSFIHDP